MSVVAPETWYRLFWVGMGIVALIAARIFLVNPILRALDMLMRHKG